MTPHTPLSKYMIYYIYIYIYYIILYHIEQKKNGGYKKPETIKNRP